MLADLPPFPDPDPARDLVLDAHLDARPEALWRAWTEAELLRRWFCPPPWRVIAAVIEPWPGGRFETVMEGPAGERHEDPGCVLHADPARRLVLTDALGAGFRPTGSGFTTIALSFTPEGRGTRYRARVLHADAEARARHAAMGFHEGWGVATRQLEATARTLPPPDSPLPSPTPPA